VLLGQIIEATTGTTLAASLRDLLRFDELGLTATYVETVEPVPADARTRAVQYLGDQRLNDLPASIDLFGGGGLVSSMRDVATFFHQLFDGRVFDRPETLDTMTSLDERTGSTAGLGVFPASTGSIDCWYHDGLWGVLALTCPGAALGLERGTTQRCRPSGAEHRLRCGRTEPHP
jgi:D-alanyl-D-alanine carboxypeptidase